MKKCCTGLLCGLMLCLLFAVTGCVRTDKPQEDRLKIVSTVFAPYDFAREVAGDRGDCTLLVPPGTEVHSYEPTARDLITVQNCDIFIYVGGESDAWVDKLLSALDTSRFRTVTLMDCAELLPEEDVTGDSVKHAAHGEETEYDEHVWTSPRNAVRIVEKLRQNMAEAAPEDADGFAARAKTYTEKLNALDRSFAEVTATAKRHMIVMADRFPLLYFVRAYGLDYRAAFPGCASETEPNAATVARLIDEVKREQIPVVFYLEMSDGRMADSLCEATGAEKRMFHSCHNVTAAEQQAGETYLSLMTRNRDVLKEALN